MTPAVNTLCDAALETAYRVAELLREPGRVALGARRALEGLPASLMLPGWQPASLLLGHPGIALLHIRRARDDAAWAAVAHAHLAAAAEAAGRAGPAVVGDLLLPATLQARQHGGYARLLERAATAHAAYAEARAERLMGRWRERGPGLAYGDYDAITGLAAQGRALLTAAGHGDDAAARALSRVLEALVAWTRTVRADGRDVPGWWCSPERYQVPRDRREFPRGDFNVGLAHGICGPLALLSLARLSGRRVAGSADAVRRAADWVLDVRGADEWGPLWPGRVAFDEEARRSYGDGAARSRPGWCYGGAGVARTLQLAGWALGDRALADAGVAAMAAALRRPLPGPVHADPGFCHGRAGLLHVAVRMASSSGRPELWEGADRLARGLVADFDEGAAFGFRQVLPDGPGPGIDNPGLLDGAAGVALALASYADARPGAAGPAEGGTEGRTPDEWDAAFLLG
ncbi:lanthionine synthetase LanC family protein [Streptomyces griseocarneus]|uniref:lanthionine synthetase LanC family protein n=1 Tax=Streptomyces griseocarneus TaxID=51201 RepID=UPI00167E02B6|nr:lanthionine synthetase LanC family protein [Streptomyces griseocarneus]MBZ6477597.1 lanthionine synthetase [Streptomyces griseocarneus]GHG83399.1 hypothetical protein GCM10018779_66530 [Streptomyces griseocarneus]